jgi:uncharacterized protein DUF6311
MDRLRRAAPVYVAAAAGGALFAWIAGIRLIDPREIGWTMRLDWQWHFVGWHVFRHEPWLMPPGRIANEFHPIGTSIAYTDSIPLVALALKPISGWLPDPLQYLGAWLLLCFALQGACGALIARAVGAGPVPQLLTGILLATSPVLLDRVGHVALCSQFLVLIAIWLHIRRWRRGAAARLAGWTALVAVTALVHPYLWLMILVLSAAAAVRYTWIDSAYRARDALFHAASGVMASAVAAWAAGWLSISGRAEMGSTGLGEFSMNLLGPFASNGIGTLLPPLPMFDAQTYEGLNYLGAGALGLVAAAGVLALRRPPSRTAVREVLPLISACALLGVVALSPRVTLGRVIVVDLPVPPPIASAWSIFRATGRFFWPAGYLLVAGAAAIVITRTKPNVAAAVLTLAIALQLIDLRGRYAQDRQVRSDPAFYRWVDLSTDAPWVRAASSRQHVVVLPTLACGAEPVPYAPLLVFAGSHALTVNTGYAARIDLPAMVRACAADLQSARRGDLRPDTVYVASGVLAAEMQRASRFQVDCKPLLEGRYCVVRDLVP